MIGELFKHRAHDLLVYIADIKDGYVSFESANTAKGNLATKVASLNTFQQNFVHIPKRTNPKTGLVKETENE